METFDDVILDAIKRLHKSNQQQHKDKSYWQIIIKLTVNKGTIGRKID